jgi:hypothetical protein
MNISISSQSTSSDTRPLSPQDGVLFASIARDGVIGTLSIGRWRGMQRLVTDLAPQSSSSRALRSIYLRANRVIPSHLRLKLNATEASARYAFRRYSFDTPFGFFIPAGAYPLVDAEMSRWAQSWMQLRDELLAHVSKRGPNVFRGVRGLNAPNQISGQDILPSRSEIRDSFRFEFQVFPVPIPELRNAEEPIRFAGDPRQQRIQQMNEHIARKYLREHEQLAGEFLRSMKRELLQMVFEAVNSVLGSIECNGMQLVGRAAERLRNLVFRFDLLNVVGFEPLEAALGEVSGHMQRPPKQRSLEEIRRLLDNISSEVRRSLLGLGTTVAQAEGHGS